MSKEQGSENAVSGSQFIKEEKVAEEKEAPRKVSRKDFVKGAAAVAGAGALASCAPAATPTTGPEAAPTCPPAGECAPCLVPGVPETWDKEADVVVVGFGGAGGSAALEAHDGGAEVIVLEKSPTPGGATVLCGGIIYAAGTSVQEAEGITDTPDEMYEYWMAMAKGLSDPELARLVADKSAEIVEWFIGMGAEFYSGVAPQASSGSGEWGLYYSGAEPDPWAAAITPPKMRGHIVEPVEPTWPYPPKYPRAPALDLPWGMGSRGTGFFKPLYEGVQARGSEVLLETSAISLIVDPTNKEVLGVKAESDGTELFIKAKRAVVLASGGFIFNEEMVIRHALDRGSTITGTSATYSDTGDGITMGMAVGAGVVNMAQGVLSYTNSPAGAIMVNDGGRRFVDETLYRVNAETMKGQRDSLVFAIFDEDIRKAANVAETTEAPTISELAIALGMDPSVLEDTVETYNGYVESGQDLEFGRTRNKRHGDPPDLGMVPITTPPFHAVKVSGNVSTSAGGLRINTKAQVIDVFGEVIPRLYAAGRNAGGVIGDMYAGSGSSIVDVITFGRIAGQNAAAEEPRD